jgi:hypothetical protein
MAGRIDNRVRLAGAIAVALVATTSVCAADRDPFEGDWTGDCGRQVSCELRVSRLAHDTYEVDYVLARRDGKEVCRLDGILGRTDHGQLSGRMGRSRGVRVVRIERDGTLALLRVSSSEMEILTQEEADRDLNGFIPAIAEWLKAKCGEVPERERSTMQEWSYYMILKDLPYARLDGEQREYVAYKSRFVTPEIESRYRIYSAKQDGVTKCQNGTLYLERDKRAPPSEFDGFGEPLLGSDGWPMVIPMHVPTQR